jgi:hypothetical protein
MNGQQLIQDIFNLGKDGAVSNEKYIYDALDKKLISDILARLIADKKTGVVSVYCCLSESNESGKKSTLTKIYACSKNNCQLKPSLEKLLAYCSNKSDFKFMSDSFKNVLINKLNKLGRLELGKKLINSKTNTKKRVTLNDKKFLISLINEVLEINLNELKIDNLNDNDSTRKNKVTKVESFNSLLILLFDLIAIPTIFNHFLSVPENNALNITQTESFIKCYDQFDEQPDRQRWHPDSYLANKLIQEDANLLGYNKYLGVSFLPCLFCNVFLDTFNFDYRGRPSKLDESWRFPTNTENNEELNENFTRVRNEIRRKVPITHLNPKTIDPCRVSPQTLYSDDICHLVKFLSNHHNNNKLLNSYNNQRIKNFSNLINDLKCKRDFSLAGIFQNKCIFCLSDQININNNNRLMRALSLNRNPVCRECEHAN